MPLTPFGEQLVSLQPTQEFLDTFDASLDTVNRWATPTTGGVGSIAATWSAGQILLTGGTALNAFSELHSQPTFIPDEPGWLDVRMRVNVESPVLTTGYRFWGIGQTTGTPTIAAPLTDACGWEVTTGGKLFAVVYAGGVRVPIQDLSAATGNGYQPADAAAHKYGLYFRGDQSYWTLDNPNTVVASFLTGASGPNVNTLPLKLLAISNSGTAETIQLNGVSVGDTAHNNQTISDPSNPWQQMAVSKTGAASVNTNPNRVQMAFGTATAGVTLGTSTTDALIVLAQQFRGGVSAGTTGTSFPITAGKTFRVTSMTVTLVNQAAAVATATATLRYNPTGAVTTASAPVAVAQLSVPATANQADRVTVAFPDGIDLPGGTTPGQFGVDILPVYASTAPVAGVWLTGYEY